MSIESNGCSEGLQKIFNKSLILTGVCVAAANAPLGIGIVVVGVGARMLHNARIKNFEDGDSPRQNLNNITVEPKNEVIDSVAK